MQTLIQHLHSAAVRRNLIGPETQIGPAEAFALVRDMPYQRASDRRPETLIDEWRGTCSGKHYLLHALFAELGYRSQVMACTSVEPLAEDKVPAHLHDLWEASGGCLVDVHNYLVLDLPEGDASPPSQMIVDATWPLGSQKYGLKVNTTFVLGQDQQLACTPIQSWAILPDQDPQAFKDQLLRQHFTASELEFRDAFILALGEWFAER